MSHQICITINDELYKELNIIKEETGMPISRLIQLKLNGYSLQKVKGTKT